MSLKTWKKEFYPVPAEVLVGHGDRALLEHALKKWRGLRKRALKRHNVYRPEYYKFIEEKNTKNRWGLLMISESSCSLCQQYVVQEGICGACPLAKKNAPDAFGCEKEYTAWVDRGDPDPMIRSIERALKKARGQ